MTKTSEFFIPVSPKSAGRPRMTRRGIPYYTKSDKEYREALDAFFSGYEGEPTESAVTLRVNFHIPPYKTSAYPYPRQDVDNLLKAIMDAMTRAKCFWTDDHLVTQLEATKEFSPTPGTHIRIEYEEDAANSTHH